MSSQESQVEDKKDGIVFPMDTRSSQKSKSKVLATRKKLSIGFLFHGINTAALTNNKIKANRKALLHVTVI